MLTTYASCWGSFLLRGSALVLLGAALLAAPGPQTVLPALAFVLAVGGANAVSTGLRMRASSAAWWLPVLEGMASFVLALAILADRSAEVMLLIPAVAALSALDGLLLLALAWRHRRSAYPVDPVAAAGLLSIGFALLLAWYPSMPLGGAALGPGAAALLLGAVSALVALRLRRICRLARHELLRDAPLACRPAARIGQERPASVMARVARAPA